MRTQARLLIALTAILWSTGGTAIKLASLDAPAIAAGRALFAAAALYLLVPSARLRPTRAIWITAIVYAVTCSLFVIANRLTTAGHAIFIQNTAPVWVLLLAPLLLRERATRAELWSVPLGLVGCGLVFADHMGGADALLGTGAAASDAAATTSTALTGDLCAFAASVTYALLIILYRKRSAAESMSATVLGNLVIVVVMAPLALQGPAPTGADLAVLAYLGIIQQALTALLFVRAVRHVSALEGSLLTLLEPLFSPVWAFLLVGETMGPLALAGAGLIAVTTIVRAVATNTPDSPQNTAPSVRSD